MRSLRSSQIGFSVVEVLMATALTGMVAAVAAGILTNVNKAEKAVNVQSTIDREFAAAAQLASNARQLSPFVSPATLGNCLRKKSSSGCAVFGQWQNYPTAKAPRQPDFFTTTSLGKCDGDRECKVERRMRFRWNCTSSACSSLETEVSVAAEMGSKSPKVKTIFIKLDARQFSDQAQIEFRCDPRQQSMVGVDFNQFTDECLSIARSNCSMPHASHRAAANGDCQTPISKSCEPGFGALGLDQTSLRCVTTGIAVRDPAGSTSTTTSTATITATATATETRTETVTEPPPKTQVCSMVGKQLGPGGGASPRVFGLAACDTSCLGAGHGPTSYCAANSCAGGVRGWMFCGDCRRDEMVCE